MILLNIFSVLTYISHFFIDHTEKAFGIVEIGNNQSLIFSKQINETNHLTQEEYSFTMKEILGVEKYDQDFRRLKPILRNITHSIILIFFMDGFINFFLNLLFGGRLIAQIASIPNIHQYDPDRKLAIQIQIKAIGIIMILSTIGMFIFNTQPLTTLFSLICGTPIIQLNREDILILLKVCIIIPLHQYHYVLQSSIVIFFVYTMIIVRRQIDDIKDSIYDGMYV